MGKILKIALIVVAIVISVIALQPQFTLTLLGKFIVTAGFTALASELQGTLDVGVGQDQKGVRDELRSTVAPRTALYGTMRATGTMVYGATHATDNKFLTLIYVIGAGEINAFTKWYVADEEVTLNGSGFVTSGKFANKIRITFHTGADDQVADTAVVSDITEWTSAHRLRGLVYFVVRYEFDPDVFAGQRPVVSTILQGYKLYNPALDSTVPGGSGTHRDDDDTTWTFDGDGNNWALVLLDYLKRDPIGARVPIEQVNMSLVIDAYNTSDEDVALDAGGTQKRYTLDGVASSAQRRNTIIDDMLRAAAGRLIYQSGQFNMYPGVGAIATITLDEDDLRAPISIQTKRPNKELVNTVVGSFVDRQNDLYRETDYPEYIDPIALAIDGEPLELPLGQPYLQDGIRAQRVGKIFIKEARQAMSITFPCKVKGMQLQAWSVVKITNARWGFNEKLFRVANWQRHVSGGVDLALQEYDAAVYTWDETTEELPVPIPADPTITDGLNVPPVSGLGGVAIQQKGDTQTAVDAIFVTWTPVDTSVAGTIIQYRRLGDTDYIDLGLLPPTIAFAFIGNLAPNTSYEIRARNINIRGITGVATTPIVVQTENFTVVDWDNLGGLNADNDDFTADNDTTYTADRNGIPISDSTSNVIFVQPDQPPSPKEGDMWIDTSGPVAFSKKFVSGVFVLSSTEGAIIGTNIVDASGNNQGDSDLLNNQQEWDDVQDDGGTRPEDNATVGATWNTDINGQPAAIVQTFFQSEEPTVGHNTSDYWIDSDNNELFRFDGVDWLTVQDDGIVAAITDAATAQATADGKVVTFAQTSEPTADGVGDLWMDTDDDNKLYRWNGSVWVILAQETADWDKIFGSSKAEDNATNNTGALADKDTVGTSDIDTDAVTGDEILDGAASLRTFGDTLLDNSINEGDGFVDIVSITHVDTNANRVHSQANCVLSSNINLNVSIGIFPSVGVGLVTDIDLVAGKKTSVTHIAKLGPDLGVLGNTHTFELRVNTVGGTVTIHNATLISTELRN